MAYQPKPIDTDHVALTEEIREITERLAENAHDRWAQQRLSEGWTYGPSRDDERKKHPGLVPYSELSEGEKEYDRIAVLQTLKSIIALGYQIRR